LSDLRAGVDVDAVVARVPVKVKIAGRRVRGDLVGGVGRGLENLCRGDIRLHRHLGHGGRDLRGFKRGVVVVSHYHGFGKERVLITFEGGRDDQ
jgi:hypothetical protein